jgi:hypothetical protein
VSILLYLHIRGAKVRKKNELSKKNRKKMQKKANFRPNQPKTRLSESDKL